MGQPTNSLAVVSRTRRRNRVDSRTLDVYEVELSGGKLPPEPPGNPTGTTQRWRCIPLSFADAVPDALPDTCLHIAVERVAAATPLPHLEQPEHAMYLFEPENGPPHETEPFRPVAPRAMHPRVATRSETERTRETEATRRFDES